MKQQWKIRIAGVGMVAMLAGHGLAQAKAPATPAPEKKSWADSLTFKGDLRYRYENIQDDSKLDAQGATTTRERNRIRVRLGAEAQVLDPLKVGLELSTGKGDPVSGNQTLGDGFGKRKSS